MAFVAAAADGAVRIRDAYPSRSNWTKECLPPAEARGDYWSYVVPMRVTVTIPAGTRLRVRLLSGDIHARTASASFDLQTRDGIVE